MSELPNGWVETILGEILTLSKEKVHPSLVPNKKYVGLEHIESESNQIIGNGVASDTKSTKSVFRKGDVLYGKLRPYLNKVALAEFDGVCSTDILVYSPSGVIDNKFLSHFLSQRVFANYTNQHSKGVNLPRTSFQAIAKYPIKLPPLNEQVRISNKLGTIFPRLQNAQKALRSIPQLVTLYKSSIFKRYLFEGFPEPHRLRNCSAISVGLPVTKLKEGWEWRKLSDIAKLESGHTPRKSNPHYWSDGKIPWISLKDIREVDQKIIYSTSANPTQSGIDNSSARLLPKGTVVFSRDISVGYVTIMGRDMATSQHFANWICGPELNNFYLQYALSASRHYLIDSGQGTTVKTIYMPALRDFYIALPSLQTQVETVEEIHRTFSKIDEIQSYCTLCETALYELRQSLLTKAFRGDLVPQDPKDETTGELLKRIKVAPTVTRKELGTRVKNNQKRVKGGNRKMIIPIVEALGESETPLSSQELISAAGYPNNATTDQIECFFLDIRQALETAQIEIWREGSQDYIRLAR